MFAWVDIKVQAIVDFVVHTLMRWLGEPKSFVRLCFASVCFVLWSAGVCADKIYYLLILTPLLAFVSYMDFRADKRLEEDGLAWPALDPFRWFWMMNVPFNVGFMFAGNRVVPSALWLAYSVVTLFHTYSNRTPPVPPARKKAELHIMVPVPVNGR